MATFTLDEAATTPKPQKPSTITEGSSSTLTKSVSAVDFKSKSMSYNSKNLAEMSKMPSNEELSDSSKRRNYEDLVSCAICFNKFSSVSELRLPKLLPCQHFFCQECIGHLIGLNSSNKATKKTIECPACKYKIDDVQDPASLPSNRTIIQLLEKESLDFKGYAACVECKNIRGLEVCFECHLPLCRECIGKHFEGWKKFTEANCIKAEESLEVYRRQMDSISNLITTNYDNANSVYEEIEKMYVALIERLTREKDELLGKVEDIRNTNSKCVNFKKETAALIAGFKMFRETNDAYVQSAMSGRIRRYEQNAEQVHKIEKEFENLIKTPFKILDRFERPVPLSAEKNILGSIVVSEHLIEKNMPSPTTPKPPPELQEKPPLKASESQKSLYPAIATNDGEGLSAWASLSNTKPQFEHAINYQVNTMASSDNYLFCADDSLNLYVYEKPNVMELKPINFTKLTLPNLKGIAVNANSIALCYIGIQKDQLKGIWKKMPLNGIVLHKRDKYIVSPVHERYIVLSGGEAGSTPLTAPKMALNDRYLFVCDRRFLRSFETSSTRLLKEIKLEYDPTAMSANANYLVVAESANSTVELYSSESLVLLRQLKLPPPSNPAKPYQLTSLLITENDLIFLRATDDQVLLMDVANLEVRASFGEWPNKINHLSMLCDSQKKILVAAASSSSPRQTKLHGYVNF